MRYLIEQKQVLGFEVFEARLFLVTEDRTTGVCCYKGTHMSHEGAMTVLRQKAKLEKQKLGEQCAS